MFVAILSITVSWISGSIFSEIISENDSKEASILPPPTKSATMFADLEIRLSIWSIMSDKFPPPEIQSFIKPLICSDSSFCADSSSFVASINSETLNTLLLPFDIITSMYSTKFFHKPLSIIFSAFSISSSVPYPASFNWLSMST